MAFDQIGECGAVFARHLHHRAQLLGEQGAERVVAPAVQLDVQAAMRNERHFAQRRERAAVAAVVIGQQHAGLACVADQMEEIAQALRIVHVGHAVFGIVAGERGQRAAAVGLRMALRQHRSAQPLLARAQTDQPQLAVFLARQQRRQLRARVGHRRERGDHQRDGGESPAIPARRS